MTQSIRGQVSIPTPADLGRRVAQAMQETVDFGREVIQDVVETSGTGYEGRRGRVVTGEMRDTARGEVVEASATRVVGRVGWWGDVPEQVAPQEFGVSQHYYWGKLIPGKSIPGMFSLRDAEEDGTEFLVDKLNDIAKDLKNGRV